MTRIRAWFLLAMFVGTLGSSKLSAGHFAIDTACGDTSLAAGSGSAKLGSPSGVEAEHCPVCHFLRAVSGASAASVACLARQNAGVTRVITVAQIPPTVHPVTQPPRGPPVLTSSHVL
jgi:hypothetical protein